MIGQKLNIQILKLKDLKPAEYNPRKSTKEQEKHLQESLKKFGCVEPIIVNINDNRKNIIVGGHFRVRELIKLGVKEVECVVVNLNLEEERELNLRLNSNTGDWDYDLLYKNFTYSQLNSVGFQYNSLEAEARKLLRLYKEQEQEQEQEFKRENTRNIKKGDLFILKNDDKGTEHRLICGDCLESNILNLLMNNKKADMVITDPPYNISIKNSTTREVIANDNMPQEEFNKFLSKSFDVLQKYSAQEAHNYIFCNFKCFSTFENIGKKHWGDEKSAIYIWVKDLPGLGCSYKEQWEIILFFTKQKSIKFYDNKESNVWQVERPSSFKFRINEKDNLADTPTYQIHLTIKPTKLIMRAIKNSCLKENGIILDIFGGSGSTLIGAEKMQRNCYMSELDELYCNVIIDRWERLTGKKAIKVNE